MLPVCLKLGQNAVAVIFMLLVFVPIGIGAVLYKTGIIGKAFLDSISAAAAAASLFCCLECSQLPLHCSM